MDSGILLDPAFVDFQVAVLFHEMVEGHAVKDVPAAVLACDFRFPQLTATTRASPIRVNLKTSFIVSCIMFFEPRLRFFGCLGFSWHKDMPGKTAVKFFLDESSVSFDESGREQCMFLRRIS